MQFFQFLAETCPMAFETNHVYTDHHTSFYMFALYLVKTDRQRRPQYGRSSKL